LVVSGVFNRYLKLLQYCRVLLNWWYNYILEFAPNPAWKGGAARRIKRQVYLLISDLSGTGNKSAGKKLGVTM